MKPMTCTNCKTPILPDERYAILKVSGAQLTFCMREKCLAKLAAAKGRLSGGVKRPVTA